MKTKELILSIKEKIIRSMDVALVGKHARNRFKERLGIGKRDAIIRLSKKAVKDGKILSISLDCVKIFYLNYVFVFAINDDENGVKKLFIKTILVENIQEYPVIRNKKINNSYKSIYQGKIVLKPNFSLTA